MPGWGQRTIFALYTSCPLGVISVAPDERPLPIDFRYPPLATVFLRQCSMSRWAINVRFASRHTAAKFASLFDEAGGGVRDMTEIDRTGEHA